MVTMTRRPYTVTPLTRGFVTNSWELQIIIQNYLPVVLQASWPRKSIHTWVLGVLITRDIKHRFSFSVTRSNSNTMISILNNTLKCTVIIMILNDKVSILVIYHAFLLDQPRVLWILLYIIAWTYKSVTVPVTN